MPVEIKPRKIVLSLRTKRLSLSVFLSTLGYLEPGIIK